jgi:SET domain-containing protein
MSKSQNGREPTLKPSHKRNREPLYVVRNSPIHGRGVFANRYIRKGTRILEYKASGSAIARRTSDTTTPG